MRVRALLILVCLTATPSKVAADARAASPADRPWLASGQARAPFSVDPGEILAAARNLPVPGGAAVDVLFYQIVLSFDEESRVTWRRHWFYRIAERGGLEAWSRSEARWVPGRQEKPSIRARVLIPPWTAGGPAEAHLLAPEAVQFPENGDVEEVAWGRLPRTQVGAVVEEEVVVRDLRPFSTTGTSGRELLALPAPIHHGRLILDAPIDLPLRYGVRQTEIQPTREVAGGRVRLTFDYHDMPAAETPPAGLPDDRPRFAHVAYATGDGWPEVAAALSRQIDSAVAATAPHILGFELGLRDLTSRDSGEDDLERVGEILSALRTKVRPAGAVASLAALDFPAPEEILEQGDAERPRTGPLGMAVLLVAALRAGGIPADLALLRAGFDQDVEVGLPGTGLFNHALVHVGTGRPLWIDPSEPFMRAGDLPSRCQDRRALVANPSIRELTRTPEARALDNRTVTRVHVYLAESGPARFVESSEYHGMAERNQRRLAASLDPEDRRLGYFDYVQSVYRAERLGEVEETFARDLSSPYKLKLEALEAGRAVTGENEAAVAIDLRPLLGALPREFLVKSTEPRTDDFIFHEPFVVEWHYWIFPPEKWAPRTPPANESRKLGGGSLTRTFEVDNGVIYAHFRLESGPPSLSPEEFEVCREAVQELFGEETLVLWYDRVRRDGKNP